MSDATAAPDAKLPQGKAPPAPESSKKPASEEPDMALEPDLPSDGRDEQGEAMIRDLPQRPELKEQPSQPDTPSPNR